jgi:hypothetical protein
MNCAISARVSTRDKGQDFTNQLVALREFAAKQDWTFTKDRSVLSPVRANQEVYSHHPCPIAGQGKSSMLVSV